MRSPFAYPRSLLNKLPGSCRFAGTVADLVNICEQRWGFRRPFHEPEITLCKVTGIMAEVVDMLQQVVIDVTWDGFEGSR